MSKFFVLILVAAFALSGCAFSQAARQRRSYEKYVRRSSITRVKRQKMFHSNKPQMPLTPPPSEPVANTQSGPQAVPQEN